MIRDLFEDDKVESPIKPHVIEKEEKKEDIPAPVEKPQAIKVENTLDNCNEYTENTYWKVDNKKPIDEDMLNEF